MLHQRNIEEFLESVARAQRSVLLLDYDGTLAPFSVDRQRAVPYPGVRDLLQQIIDAGRTRLVIVTGRDAREIDPFLRLRPAPEIWGSHGLQRLLPDGTCDMPEIPAAVAEVLDDARRWLEYQGLHKLAERKPGSIAVHWRALEPTEAEELRGRIIVGWFPIAERANLKLLEFDGGVEMRMPDLDKGDAVRTVLRETGPDVPTAYLGDDITDERAFRALEARGFGILVRPAFRRTSAQAWLKPPEELRDFLSRWLAATTETTQLTRSATY
ncbi:MAG TPA: trehalose-phosphatase [Candidatus Sulfotelmatobacter sp.]|nr:trehalose-phosphatase [Candidatus Sulfotelmatobacter sp.]